MFGNKRENQKAICRGHSRQMAVGQLTNRKGESVNLLRKEKDQSDSKGMRVTREGGEGSSSFREERDSA